MTCTTTSKSFSCSPSGHMPGKNGGPHRKSHGSSIRRSTSGSENSQKLCTQESISELIKAVGKDAKNIKVVSEFVQKHSGKLIKFMNCTSSYLYLCDLNGTIYMGQTYMKEGWEESYLPETTRMEVFGTLEVDCVDMSPCPSEQWVILVGEDGRVYAYWDEELQLIAQSLREFVENGKSQVYDSYLYPESSEKDDCAQPSEEIQKIQQRTRDFVNNQADPFKMFMAKIELLKKTNSAL